MKFNGSTWQYVGTQGFTPTAAYAENMDIKNGIIRVAYTEGTVERGLAVMRYNTLAKPEINITGNGNNILKGTTTTSVANGTNFGQTGIGSTTKKTYTIQNTDEGTLNISGITSNNGLFVVSGAPTTVAPNGSATFNVTFSPTALGVQNATITVNNNDADEGVYDFAVTAESSAPPVDPDYVLSNISGALIITDRVGNSDVLEVTQNGTNINFNAAGRTYALNGGATTALPVDIPKSGLTSIVINTEGGNDTIKFSNYITAMPSLTVNGGAGDDVVYSIGGGITFLANANLDLDLTNDASAGDKDEVLMVPLSNFEQ